MSSPEISNIRVRRKHTENRHRHRFRNARVTSDAYVRKGARKPVVRHISLEEYILCVKLDSVINVRSTKDASHRIVPHDLIANGSVYNTYLGC
jgi:hypothetical protein